MSPFIIGFVKRAKDYGVSKEEAVDIYRKAVDTYKESVLTYKEVVDMLRNRDYIPDTSNNKNTNLNNFKNSTIQTMRPPNTNVNKPEDIVTPHHNINDVPQKQSTNSKYIQSVIKQNPIFTKNKS